MENRNMYIGVDIGKTGFVVSYDKTQQLWSSYPIPLIHNTVDIKSLSELFGVLSYGYISPVACIEDLHAIYGSSAKGTYEFGFVAGVVEALLSASNIAFTKVNPRVWQREMFVGVPMIKKPSSTGKTEITDTKAMAEIAAKRLFPDMDMRKTERCRKPDHNKIDALLLCEYARRHY